MIYRVGQRVRIVGCKSDLDHVGREATIVGGPEPGFYKDGSPAWLVEIDGRPCPYGIGTWWRAHPRDLAPLLDPSASRFIESMERFAKQPVDIQKFAQRDVGAVSPEDQAVIQELFIVLDKSLHEPTGQWR